MRNNPSAVRFLALAAFLILISTASIAGELPAPNGSDEPAAWWRTDRIEREGLPAEVPRVGTVLTVDTTEHMAYLWRDGNLVIKGPAATGRDEMLIHGRERWMFRTPHGRIPILEKIVDPVWSKPDWAFVEKHEPVPPPDSQLRYERGVLGDYALDLGDGILVHGTKDRSSLGKAASHGCIRLGAEMLKTVYDAMEVGEFVYVY
ncbi:MAG: L,D-transpeptidase [Thermoanaerobaculia bacterium]